MKSRLHKRHEVSSTDETPAINSYLADSREDYKNLLNAKYFEVEKQIQNSLSVIERVLLKIQAGTINFNHLRERSALLLSMLKQNMEVVEIDLKVKSYKSTQIVVGVKNVDEIRRQLFPQEWVDFLELLSACECLVKKITGTEEKIETLSDHLEGDRKRIKDLETEIREQQEKESPFSSQEELKIKSKINHVQDIILKTHENITEKEDAIKRNKQNLLKLSTTLNSNGDFRLIEDDELDFILLNIPEDIEQFLDKNTAISISNKEKAEKIPQKKYLRKVGLLVSLSTILAFSIFLIRHFSGPPQLRYVSSWDGNFSRKEKLTSDPYLTRYLSSDQIERIRSVDDLKNELTVVREAINEDDRKILGKKPFEMQASAEAAIIHLRQVVMKRIYNRFGNVKVGLKYETATSNATFFPVATESPSINIATEEICEGIELKIILEPELGLVHEISAYNMGSIAKDALIDMGYCKN